MSTELINKARQILQTNDLGGYTVPTQSMYPYQWNWDSVFVALGFATFDQNRAWLEIENLFESQWEDGFVPHIIFRKDEPSYFPGPNIWVAGDSLPTSGISNPPVASSIIKRIWDSCDHDENIDRLKSIFPKLVAWHRWFHTFRDPLNNGLVLTTHPWETGRDNSPEWTIPCEAIDISNVSPFTRLDTSHVDSSMRPTDEEYKAYITLVEFGRDHNWDHDHIAKHNPFRMLDVGMSMILLRANRDLLSLAEFLGEQDIVDELNQQIALSEKGIDYLWDDSSNTFCSYDLIAGKHSGFISSASFLAFYAGAGSDEQHQQLLENLKNIEQETDFLMPSFAPGQDGFDTMRYWRGPVWAVVNYMILNGLAESGYQDWADRIASDTKSLVELSGFHEAFSPYKGTGTGGDNFSWTAAIYLALSNLTNT